MQRVNASSVCLGSLLLAVSLSGMAAAQPGDLAAKNQQAAQAMSNGRFDEAVGMYRELLEARPNDPGLLLNFGMALAMAGREPDAIEPLQRAVKLRPSLIPAHMFLGSSYLTLGEPEKAVEPLERVVAARPADAESHGLLAQAYLASGNTPRAVQSFRALTDLAPEEPGAWYGLAQAYNGIVQEMLESFEDLPIDSPWKILLLADALHEDERWNDAFGQYRVAVERLPWMKSLHDAITSIYEKSGHEDWAATARKRAAAVPLDCAAHEAECEFRAKRFGTAFAVTAGKHDEESRYWRARAANELARAALATLDALPDSRERREMRAELARSERRHADSVKEIQAALTFAPDDRRLLEELATSHYLARDYEQAIAIIEPLVRTDPDASSLLALKGEALLALQRLDEALPALKRAVELDASDAAAQVALGRAYVLKGEFAPAIPLLEAALPHDEDGTVHFQLARAYQGTGQPEKAKPLLEKYRELQQETSRRAAGASETKITPP